MQFSGVFLKISVVNKKAVDLFFVLVVLGISEYVLDNLCRFYFLQLCFEDIFSYRWQVGLSPCFYKNKNKN